MVARSDEQLSFDLGGDVSNSHGLFVIFMYSHI